MKILAFDTSSQSASCALTEDGKLLGEFFENVKLTHSQTILPMTDALLRQSRTPLSEIGLFAVTVGPGSFTGLRIGLSAVKGIAHTLNKQCVGVSTLEALARNLPYAECLVAPVLDARCSQVYTALFRWQDGKLFRLEADSAITVQQLGERLKKLDSPVFLVGDGAEMCYTILKEQADSIRLAPQSVRYTKASSVAAAAETLASEGFLLSASALVPAYLRLPQAERELLAKKQHNKMEL